METVINPQQTTKTEQANAKNGSVQKVEIINTRKNIWDEAEKARFGIIPLLLTVVACIGGIAAAYGTGYGIFELALVAFPTMITLSLILAVAPMKQIIYAGAVCVVMDALVLIF